MIKKIIPLTFIVLTFIFENVIAQIQNREVLKLDPSVRLGKLPNGFTYYIKSTGNTDKVSMKLVVKAGYLQENSDQVHLAHVLEHILMQPMMDTLKQFGYSPARDYNALTGFDRTEYWLAMPDSNVSHLEFGVRELRQISNGRLLDSAAIESGKGSTLNEIMVGVSEGPKKSLTKDILFDIDPIFLISGERNIESVKNFKHSSLIRFYNKWYRPDLEAIIIVGNINLEQTEAMIIRQFSDIAKPSGAIVSSSKYIPAYKNQHFVTIEKRNEHLTIGKFVKHKSFDLLTPNDYEKAVIVDLYNIIVAQRFGDALSELNNIAGVNHYYHRYAFSIPSAGVDALTSIINFLPDASNQDIKTAYETLLKEEQKILRYGFLDIELSIAKQKLKQRYAENDFSVLEESERLTEHFFGKFAAPAVKTERHLYSRLMDKISLADINIQSRRWYSQEHPQILVLQDQDSLMRQFKRMISQVNQKIQYAQIQPYEYSHFEIPALMSAKEVASLNKEKIYYSRTSFTELGTVRFRLQNGIEILLKPLKVSGNRAKKVILNVFKAGKGSIQNDDNFSAALLAISMLGQDSVGTLSQREFKKYLSKSNIEVEAGFSLSRVIGLREGFSMEAPVEALEALLQIMYLYTVEPHFNNDKLQEIRLKQDKTNYIDSSAFEKIYRNYSVLSDLAFPTSYIDTVRLKTVMQGYKKYYQDVSEYVYVFTGDFNPDSVENLIIRYLDAIPGTPVSEPIMYKSVSPSGGSDAYLIEQSDINNGSTFNGFFYVEELNFTPSKSMHLKVLLGLLKELLFKKLRDEMGGTYAVNINSSQIGPQLLRIGFQFTSNYGDSKELIKATWDEIEKLQTNGPTPELLNNVVKQTIQSFEVEKQTHEFWQDYFYLQLFNKKDLTELKYWKDELNNVTVDDVKECAKKYLNHNDLQIFRTK